MKKKHFEFLLLLSPAILWGLSTVLLGDQFTLPNRLILAVLCTACGAVGLLMQRKAVGLLALIVGIGMLASVPVIHDMPTASFVLRMQDYQLPAAATIDPVAANSLLARETADLVSIKGSRQQAQDLAAVSGDFRYQYASCDAEGRTFLSRLPILQVSEEQRMGTTQVRGTLQAGDTAVRFVVLDFSELGNEEQARKLAGEYLAGADSPSIALIDTGNSGNRIPFEWISYTTGFTKSQRPWTAFTGSFESGSEDNSQVMLYAPNVRCRGFETSALGMVGTYVVN